MTVTEKTWPVADLLALAVALLEKSGLDHAKAETVAELLVAFDFEVVARGEYRHRSDGRAILLRPST